MEKIEKVFDEVYEYILEMVLGNNFVGSIAIIAFAINNILLIWLATPFRYKLIGYVFWIVIFELIFTMIVTMGFAHYFRAKGKLTWLQVIGMTKRQTTILFLSSFTILFIPGFLLYIFMQRGE